MKRLYIEDALHEQLKNEAKRQGRTLQWWVSEKLSAKTIGQYKEDRSVEEVLPDPVVVTEADEWEEKLKALGVQRGI